MKEKSCEQKILRASYFLKYIYTSGTVVETHLTRAPKIPPPLFHFLSPLSILSSIFLPPFSPIHRFPTPFCTSTRRFLFLLRRFSSPSRPFLSLLPPLHFTLSTTILPLEKYLSTRLQSMPNFTNIRGRINAASLNDDVTGRPPSPSTLVAPRFILHK